MLTLDLTDKHLSAGCRRSRKQQQQLHSDSVTSGSAADQQFTFHRDFTLTNTGKRPVRVRGFLIGPHVGVASSSYKSKSTLASLSDQPIGSNNLLSHLIGQLQCQGFGFKIVNCDPKPGGNNNNSSSNSSFEPFTLKPNASRKIGISFTPDFTTAKAMATLTIVTDEGPETDETKDWITVLEDHFLPTGPSIVDVGRRLIRSVLPIFTSVSQDQEQELTSEPATEQKMSDACEGSNDANNNKNKVHLITYSLIATVPKNLLPVCDRSLPRPYQELILYYTLVVLMICLVAVTCAFAFIDGTRVLNFSFYP